MPGVVERLAAPVVGPQPHLQQQKQVLEADLGLDQDADILDDQSPHPVTGLHVPGSGFAPRGDRHHLGVAQQAGLLVGDRQIPLLVLEQLIRAQPF